jgi:hypothetical protein
MTKISVTLEAVACVPESLVDDFTSKRVGALRPIKFAVKKCKQGEIALRWVLDSADNVISEEVQDHVAFVERILRDNYAYLEDIKASPAAEISCRIYADFDELVMSFSLNSVNYKVVIALMSRLFEVRERLVVLLVGRHLFDASVRVRS